MHTHQHPYTSVLTHLSTHLPHSGPLFRRIQHQTIHPSPTAQVLASFPPNSDSDLGPGIRTRTETETDTEIPWLAAYADIHNGPDTQVWLFSSLETKSNLATSESESQSRSKSSTRPSNSEPISSQETEVTKSQLHSLFTLIRSTLIPPYLDWVSSQPRATAPIPAKEERVKKIPNHPATSVLAGTVHKTLVSLICELAKESKVRILRGQDVFYSKYCFASSAFDGRNGVEDEDLGDGGEWWERDGYGFTDSNGVSGIQEKHLDLVKSRTSIPRSKRALLAMGGVALYHYPSLVSGDGGDEGKEKGEAEMPIAWAFLGFDGSLCTLHVEPEHRGRGLAGMVGKEVMKRGVEVFGSSYLDSTSTPGGQAGAREEWFFADVAIENAASRRVMEKMDGVERWNVAWMVVEVD
ncbi:hypothetical protein BDW62DRAFT_199190 [Aspergillus aurantiobrunneus]